MVMGLGASTNEIIRRDLSGFVTIGVNDIGAVYQPRYLLTLDTPESLDRSMKGKYDRSSHVVNTEAEYLFVPDNMRAWDAFEQLNDRIVGIRLGDRSLRGIDDDVTYDYSVNSPYVAAILAYRMGCESIGLIGVDFTDDHCHANDGEHELVRSGRLKEIDRDYFILRTVLRARGCALVNLSAGSRLTALPKESIEKYIGI